MDRSPDVLPFAPRADDPPLTPDSPEARDRLERELAKPEYQDDQGLLDRVVEWVLRQLDSGPTGELPGALLWFLLLAVVVGIVVVAVRAVRSNPARSPAGEGEVFDRSEQRTAEEHRSAARAAAAAGDHDLAVLEAFRGMARDGVERTLLPEMPGMTVHEVVLALGRAFPTKGGRLTSSAAAFDDVRYGDTHVDPGTAGSVIALGEEVAGERPVLPDVAALGGTTAEGAR